MYSSEAEDSTTLSYEHKCYTTMNDCWLNYQDETNMKYEFQNCIQMNQYNNHLHQQHLNENADFLNLPQSNFKKSKHFDNFSNMSWDQHHVKVKNTNSSTIIDCEMMYVGKEYSETPMNTSDASSSASSRTNEDIYCESLYKAYLAGNLSKSRYKRLIANERERRRMHGLNVAFENLRSVLPSMGSNKQFSKYETLQMAKSYIIALKEILIADSANSMNNNFSSNNDWNEHSNILIKKEIKLHNSSKTDLKIDSTKIKSY